MSFKVGDRVKNPKGITGTVQFVGKVSFAQGKHVGVQLDTPDGDNDGSVKKKRYFKCKKKFGMIQKPAYWTKDKGGKGGKKKPRKSARLDAPPLKGKGGDNAPDIAEPRKSKKGGRSAAAQTKEFGVQTEPPSEAVENEYFCKLITRLYTEQNDKLTKERDEALAKIVELQKHSDECETKMKMIEYEKKQQDGELDPLRDQLEMKEVEIEDLNIKLEMLQLDYEDLQETLDDDIDTYVKKVGSDDKEHAELVAMNQELQTSLAQLMKVGGELMDSKDKHINYLQTDTNYVDNLAARLKDLLQVERQVLTLKTKVKELQDQNAKLADADVIAKELTNYNNILEGELQDWREWVLDVEDERKTLEDLNDENEGFIEDLTKHAKEMKQQMDAETKELSALKIEKKDLQKEVFELRNKDELRQEAMVGIEYMNFAPTLDGDGKEVDANAASAPTDDADDTTMDPDDMKMMSSPVANAQPLSAADSKKLATVWNENLKLQAQLDQMRSILMSTIEQSVKGQGNYVCYQLMKQYLPSNSQDVDFRGIEVLSEIQRILYKSKATRNLLERFYGDPNSSAMKNPKLARMSHTLCPLILTQENYMRGIQRGFLTVEEEDEWRDKVSKFQSLAGNSKIEQTYDLLLRAIEKAGNSNEMDFDIDLLNKHESRLKKFMERVKFEKFSPSAELKDDTRVHKSIVLQHMSETHYRFQSLSIKLNMFNSRMFELVHAPVQTTKRITSVAVDDDDKKDDDADAHVDYEESVDDVIQYLKIGAVEKLFRLRNDVVSNTQQILTFCQPVELGFSKANIAQKLLDEGNNTSIKWAQLKACKSISFEAIQRVDGMLEKINKNVKVYQLPRKRVNNVNKIIEDEEEGNNDGLIVCLENAYTAVSEVRKVIGSTLHANSRCTDDMDGSTYDNFVQPRWEKKAAGFREIFEKQQENKKLLEEQKKDLEDNATDRKDKESKISSQKRVIEVLTEQITKEKEKATDLRTTQTKNKELLGENEKLTTQVKGLAESKSSLEESVANKTKAIKKYKDYIAKINQQTGEPQKPGHQPTEDDPKEKAATSYTPNIRDNDIEYSGLLQQTITSLRKQVTELTMSKKIINCAMALKPLPFSLLRDRINKEKQEKSKKKKKRRKKKKVDDSANAEADGGAAAAGDGGDGGDDEKDDSKNDDANNEENKDDGGGDNEDEYEWVTDDEFDEKKDGKENIDSSVLSKELETQLSGITLTLNTIRSAPRIVDLTDRNRKKELGQDMIGRQMKLRDVRVKYNEIKKELQEQRQKDPKNKQNDTIAKKTDLKKAWGTIQIPFDSSLFGGSKDDKAKRVVLPPKQFDLLRSRFAY